MRTDDAVKGYIGGSVAGSSEIIAHVAQHRHL